MKKLQYCVLSLIFVVLTFSHVFSQDISGKYEGTATVQPYGTLPISVNLRQKDGKIDGSIASPMGETPILEASLSGENLRITIDAEGYDLVLEGQLRNGNFKGKAASENLNGTFDVARTGDAAPPADLSPIISQSKEKWHEDLRFLAEELPKKHKNAFHTASKQQFEKAVTDLGKNIPTMNDSQIIIEMSKVAAMIGDGHTALQWPDAFGGVPVRFFWFEKELRVFRVSKDLSYLRGARLVKIGGVSVEEIFTRSLTYISQGESPGYTLSANAWRMRFPVFLHALGVAKSPESAVYEFIGANGKYHTVELKNLVKDTKVDWIYSYKSAPLWLQNRDKDLFFRYLPNKKAVYVQFQSYPRRKEFKKFSDELFSFINKNQVKKLIFDMRLNGGGDFTRGQDYFITPLKARKSLTEKGRLFVLTGRWTVSAGMSNSAHFRNEFGAILVGEPTGSRPNGYQENRNFRLPNSRLEFSVSVDMYKFSENDTPGLIPDKIIPSDWKSLRNGRDPVLEWVLAYPEIR